MHNYLCKALTLQKVFDSVEIPELLDRLYKARINGKVWRLEGVVYRWHVLCEVWKTAVWHFFT